MRAWLPSLALLLLAGCSDLAEPCGPAMRLDAMTETCVCADNAVARGRDCVACGGDEVVLNGECACPEGEAKDGAGMCGPAPGLGDACADSAACRDATYSYCAPTSAGSSASTCTKPCTSDDDCDGGYTCATWEPEPYCRAFSGAGKPCTSAADCAGLDANSCDVFVTHTCVVRGCSLSTGGCPRGLECCDLSQFNAGTVCGQDCP